MDKPHSDFHPHWSTDDGAIPSLTRVVILRQGSIGDYTENFSVKKSRILEFLIVELCLGKFFYRGACIFIYLFIYLFLLYGKYAKGLQATGACSLMY